MGLLSVRRAGITCLSLFSMVGVFSPIDFAQKAHAASAFCSGGTQTVTFNFTGAGTSQAVRLIALEQGETLTFSTLASATPPTQTDATENNTGTTFLNTAGPGQGTFTAPDAGTVTYDFLLQTSLGSAGTTTMTITCTGAGSKTNLTDSALKANINRATVQTLFGGPLAVASATGAQHAGALLSGWAATKVILDQAQGQRVNINQRPAIVTEEGEIKLLVERIAELKIKVKDLEQEFAAGLERHKAVEKEIKAATKRLRNLEYGQENYRQNVLGTTDLSREIEQEKKRLGELQDEANKFYRLIQDMYDANAEIEEKAEALNERGLNEDGRIDLRDDVQGIINLSYAEHTSRSGLSTANSPFKMQLLGDKGTSFSINLLPDRGTGAQGISPDYDAWVTGRYSFIEDNSNAGRNGYTGNVNIGVARRISQSFAVAVEGIFRAGELEISSAQSETDLLSGGVNISGVYALGGNMQISLSGIYEHGWLDTVVSGASGSYTVNRYGVVAGLSGTYAIDKVVLQPQINGIYASTDTSSYTDSGGTFVQGQNLDYGSLNAGLTVSTALPGSGSLVSWQPHATARLHYNFTQEENITLGPNLIIDDSQFNAELGAGVMTRFRGGASASFAASYYGLGSDGATAFNLGAQVSIPLN